MGLAYLSATFYHQLMHFADSPITSGVWIAAIIAIFFGTYRVFKRVGKKHQGEFEAQVVTALPENCLTPPKSKFLLWQIKTSPCRRQTAKGLPWKKISRAWPTNSTCHSRKYNCDKINDILSFGSVRFQPN